MLKRLAHVGDRLRSKLRKRGIDYNPYDNAVRERISDRMFAEHADLGPMGSAIRSRAILEIIESGSPSSLLTDAYFSNLELLLGAKRPRQRDGQIVIGLGTGRCGSTSLVEIFSTIRDSFSTHETPPLISWSPQRCEVDFHFKRLALLSKYFPLV